MTVWKNPVVIDKEHRKFLNSMENIIELPVSEPTTTFQCGSWGVAYPPFGDEKETEKQCTLSSF